MSLTVQLQTGQLTPRRMDASPMHQLQVPLLAEEGKPAATLVKSSAVDIEAGPGGSGKAGVALTTFERQLSTGNDAAIHQLSHPHRAHCLSSSVLNAL